MHWPKRFKPDGAAAGYGSRRRTPSSAATSLPPRLHDEESRIGDDGGHDIDHHHHNGLVLNGTRLEPSSKLTAHQFFYIFVLDGLGGLIVSGGINFGIAYAMYRRANPEKDPVRLFQLPNTLAGDGVVTIFVQCLVTWLIETTLVNYDVKHGSVQTIGCIGEPRHWLVRSFFMLPKDPQLGAPPLRFFGVMPAIQLLVRGLLFGLVSFFPFWPIAVGILAGVGQRRRDGDYYYDNVWTPQVYKLLLGGVLGLVTGPLMAMYWLARYGWESQTALRYAEEAAARYAEEAASRGEEGLSSPVFGRPSEDSRKAAGSRDDRKLSGLVDGPDSDGERAPRDDEGSVDTNMKKQVDESSQVHNAAESDTASSQGDSTNQDQDSGEVDRRPEISSETNTSLELQGAEPAPRGPEVRASPREGATTSNEVPRYTEQVLEDIKEEPEEVEEKQAKKVGETAPTVEKHVLDEKAKLSQEKATEAQDEPLGRDEKSDAREASHESVEAPVAS
ncbi:hypothetical protein XA68_11837 [Ophiocordyceps unilateralis]|uniref:Uncharacterized protein n=1 Tax=Ophiocordyceps unilateralis TaxID=268505 RepID=A0A2A9PEJ6_OPHUN|nr:hypothetical protein XA68_11837 [Ophiocordyceps unilateralis]